MEYFENDNNLENKELDLSFTKIQNKEEKTITGLYRDWFVDYASYVILERAVPHIKDGLKPVQRRILYAMKLLDDGRYNKVANIIGYTMQFHPHGDASIGEALVQLGQKNLLIDTQGNWGNIFTGDSAAAARYIEARLSKFALEVVFNNKTTKWKNSYDGRNKEPIHLPVKFPLLLAQGVEGIAVGLASKILPHNFNEICDAAISYLKGHDFVLYPDFPTGGFIDVSKYNDGKRGGRVRVRAKIEKTDKKTLTITEIPFGTTTTSLIESILSASEKGKIKIRKIDDKTSDKVSIVIQLTGEQTPDQAIDALYAFTDCELSISTNATVIDDDKPLFLGVSDILKINVDNTLDLLKQELTIKLNELNEDLFYNSLEKIFIENRIYLAIENCTSFEEIIQTIDHKLQPFKNKLIRPYTYDDLVKLTEIKIKRISKFDSQKADELIAEIKEKIKQTQYNLDNIVQYTIDWFTKLKEKYGHLYPRKSEIRNFDDINIVNIAVADRKLYVNYQDGFVGTELKDATFIRECSQYDDIIVFLEDGTYFVTKVPEKLYVGKNPIYVDIFRKNDFRTTYNIVYVDGKTGVSFVKRFNVTSIMKDKKYNITQGTPNSKILYFSANPNAETEIIIVKLRPKNFLKKLQFEFDFAQLAIRSRESKGNVLTKHGVYKIVMKEKGKPTITKKPLWFDKLTLRIKETNGDNSIFLGEFEDNDKIIALTQRGFYYLTNTDLANHYDDDIVYISKFDENKVFNVVYYFGQAQSVYLKRITFPDRTIPTDFIPKDDGSYLIAISDIENPIITLNFKDPKKSPKSILADDFIKVKSYETKGKKLSEFEINSVEFKQPEISPTIDFEVEFPQEDTVDKDYDATSNSQNTQNTLF